MLRPVAVSSRRSFVGSQCEIFRCHHRFNIKMKQISWFFLAGWLLGSFAHAAPSNSTSCLTVVGDVVDVGNKIAVALNNLVPNVLNQIAQILNVTVPEVINVTKSGITVTDSIAKTAAKFADPAYVTTIVGLGCLGAAGAGFFGYWGYRAGKFSWDSGIVRLSDYAWQRFQAWRALSSSPPTT